MFFVDFGPLQTNPLNLQMAFTNSKALFSICAQSIHSSTFTHLFYPILISPKNLLLCLLLFSLFIMSFFSEGIAHAKLEVVK